MKMHAANLKTGKKEEKKKRETNDWRLFKKKTKSANGLA